MFASPVALILLFEGASENALQGYTVASQWPSEPTVPYMFASPVALILLFAGASENAVQPHSLASQCAREPTFPYSLPLL